MKRIIAVTGPTASGKTALAVSIARQTGGEIISADTFDAHFEKAYADINGAYTMINREFVRYIRSIHPQIQWINREDDTGRLSLRQSKLSYHPERMVEKYKVELPNE